MVTALKRGFAVCGVAYGAIGISGLLLGGPSVDANVLKVLPAGSPAVALTKLALCICMVCETQIAIQRVHDCGASAHLAGMGAHS